MSAHMSVHTLAPVCVRVSRLYACPRTCVACIQGPFHTEELVLNCMSSFAVLLDDCLRDYDRAEEMYTKVAALAAQ